MKCKQFLGVITVLISLLGFLSCNKNSKEAILENLGPCDTTNVTYTNDIRPLINQFCSTSGCHTAVSVAGGYNLEDYASLRDAALGSRLLGSIKHNNGFSPMPKGGGKLTDCQIKFIEKWIQQGAPNN